MSLANDPVFETLKTAIEQGHNLFISGVGGCGKSYILKKLFEHFQPTKHCQLTSTTGISAYNLGGVTLHSVTRLVIPSELSDPEKWIQTKVKQIKSKEQHFNWYKEIDLIFVDEVSMIGSMYLDAFHLVASQLRANSKPFGGIQVVLSGDMLQLPPVNDNFPFTSESWQLLNLKYYRLTKAHRFAKQDWVDLLQRARLGEMNKDDCKMLESRLHASTEDEFIPTYLASKNDVVDKINQAKLDAIPLDYFEFKAFDAKVYYDDYGDEIEMVPTVLDHTVSNQFMAEQSLKLKPGCQVMLIANLNVERGLANGSVGIVRSISDKSVIVKFDDKNQDLAVEIEPFRFKIEYKDRHYARIQMPLKLAFATSIHKSQGLTLSKLEIDIGSDVFMPGQSYVAMSRCKDLSGLFVKALDVSKIKPDSQALKFEKEFLKRCVNL